MASSASFPKQCDVKVVPTVQARPVATPMHSRHAISPSRTRFNSDPRLPTATAVVVSAPNGNIPGCPSTKPPPLIVHALSAQSLPNVAAARSNSMCRSRSFTGEVMHSAHSTPRVMQCGRQIRSNAGSWVPPPIPSVPAPMSYAPPPGLQNVSCSGGATMSWAPPPVSPTGTQPVVQVPFSAHASPMQLRRGGSYTDVCQASFVPPGVEVVTGMSYCAPPMHASDGNPIEYKPGTEVVIGSHRFRCIGVLGRGSFSEVWSGEELGTKERLEVALKDIHCSGQADLQQSLFEADMLQTFAAAAKCTYGQGAPPPQVRIPFYLSHRVDQRRDGKAGQRIRMAMTRVPGEPVDAFLKRPPPQGQDVQAAVRRGCMLAMALIKQLGPTLELISRKAIHRDVNAHNVLLSDAIDGGPFNCNVDPEDVAPRASFWLIDFGLAVDSTTWHTAWREADIGGDCRYWPQSSWFVSFWGADEIAAQKHLCSQYMNRLDIFGLGITALELLCTTALDGSNAAGCQSGSSDGLRGSWRRLLNAWTKYWTDVTRWHTMIYRVFSLGGDVGPLYQELAKERVVDKILSRMAQIRQCLQACVNRTEDPRIQKLLSVLAEMLDESSSVGLREAVEMLGGECPTALRQQRISNVSNVCALPSKPALPCPTPPIGVGLTGSSPSLAPSSSLAQVTIQAISAQAAVIHASAQNVAVQAAVNARARVDAAQLDAHQQREAFRNFMGMEDPSVQALRWQPPAMNNNSFVPHPAANNHFVQAAASNNSFVPPVVKTNSFVPPAAPNHSFVPPVVAAQQGSYVPAPLRPTREASIEDIQGKVVQPAPSRPVRPRHGGA